MLEAIVPILLAAWAPFCVGVDAHGFFRIARGDHSFATVSGRDLVRAQYQNLAARKTRTVADRDLMVALRDKHPPEEIEKLRAAALGNGQSEIAYSDFESLARLPRPVPNEPSVAAPLCSSALAGGK